MLFSLFQSLSLTAGTVLIFMLFSLFQSLSLTSAIVLIFMLFSLFQSAKPKTGLFCFLITEARVTTALEMPDHENAFVLKVMLPLRGQKYFNIALILQDE